LEKAYIAQSRKTAASSKERMFPNIGATYQRFDSVSSA
jgi:hypothetical protein